jgi:hypothetical protein
MVRERENVSRLATASAALSKSNCMMLPQVRAGSVSELRCDIVSTG